MIFIFSTFDLLILFNILFAITIIFFEHNEPTVTWAWIMVLFLLPYFGFIIYLIFGLDGKKSRPYLIKNRKDKEIVNTIYGLPYDGLKFIHMHENKVLLEEYLGLWNAERFESLVHLNHETNNSVISFNNRVDTFFNGEEMFSSLFLDIENAKSFIHIQFYIIRNDSIGTKLIDKLIDATNRGVEVKILTDKIGSIKLPRNFSTLLRNKGVYLSFFPIPTTFSLNFRNHRKICVIDGIYGYTGGFNVGDEYLGNGHVYSNWRDTHIRIHGDIVKMLEISFIKDWNYSNSNNKISLEEKYFPKASVDSVYVSKVQIVTSGPDTKYKNIQLALTKLINLAEKSVHIVTPYFVPDTGLLNALINAHLSGVHVTIMIPENPDHPFVFGASLSYIKDLIDIGIDCYAYSNGFIHSKVVIVDGCVSSIGSANFDIRSFSLNFEVSAFVYSNYVAKTIIKRIDEDIKSSTKLTKTWYYERSYIEKAKEALSRLLSPLL